MKELKQWLKLNSAWIPKEIGRDGLDKDGYHTPQYILFFYVLNTHTHIYTCTKREREIPKSINSGLPCGCHDPSTLPHCTLSGS